MITAYDWMKSAREQNNFQKDSGEFSRREEMTRSLFSSKNLREKDPFGGKNFNDLDFNLIFWLIPTVLHLS